MQVPKRKNLREPTVLGTTAWWIMKTGGAPAEAARHGAPSHVVEQMKSLVFGVGTGDAEALVQSRMAAEALVATNAPGGWFSAIRPDTIPGELNVKYAAATSDPAAALVPEGRSIRISRMEFGRRLLAGQKVGGAVVISKELARHASGISIIDRQLSVVANATVDAVFGAQLQVGIPHVDASGGSPKAILKDSRRAAAQLPSGTQASLWLAMGIETAKRITFATTDTGAIAFPQMSPSGGFIGTTPVAVTTALTNDVVLTDASALITAEDALELDQSSAATLEMDSSPSSATNNGASPLAPVQTTQVSLFQAGAIALRVVRHFDWAAVRDVHSVRIAGAGLAWGLDDSTSPPS